jgi:ribonuclease T2
VRGGIPTSLVALAAALVFSSPVQAQSWGNFWHAPAKPTPCVLDECLNGGAKAAPQPPAGPTEPAPSTQAAGAVASGDFDFYLLTLSWSPGFCDLGGDRKARDQCSAGAGLGFVVHGLWPQYQHGYPQDCDGGGRPVSRAALDLTRGVFPDEGLARYEWRKHGACAGLSPEAFFAAVRRARDEIAIPEAFKAPREAQTVSPRDLARAFIAANPGLRLDAMATTCRNGELEDVRFCLSKDLRSFVTCPEVARRTCRASTITAPPVR